MATITRKQYALSTVDNPFNPFDNFDDWYKFDNEKGYNSSGMLMRIAKIGNDFTDKEENEAIEEAIDRIIELDFTNTYIKVENSITIVEDNESSLD